MSWVLVIWEIHPRYKRALLNDFCKLTQIHSTKMYRLVNGFYGGFAPVRLLCYPVQGVFSCQSAAGDVDSN